MKYESKLNLKQTQLAIKEIKDYFQLQLKQLLNLQRISGPIIVEPATGLNDNLTGNNNAVNFFVQDLDKRLEIVQSLAKWKRYALHKYGFGMNEGIYVDMNAIRCHETLDELHSLYVDQWDWEYVISKEQRNIDTLKDIVRKIFKALKQTETYINEQHKCFHSKLPNEIKFFQSQELEDKYPNKTFDEMVYEETKNNKAIFVIGIGKKLKSGKVFDDRSRDYDDWDLNGDFFVWSDVIQKPIELSSMGIRVNKQSLASQAQLDINKIEQYNQYYQSILREELPLTIGGGIGQSRLCMFLLEKAHVGEVQCSVWDEQEEKRLKSLGINLL